MQRLEAQIRIGASSLNYYLWQRWQSLELKADLPLWQVAQYFP
jgi:hypothetical protein